MSANTNDAKTNNYVAKLCGSNFLSFERSFFHCKLPLKAKKNLLGFGSLVSRRQLMKFLFKTPGKIGHVGKSHL
jgi:hypothetical protein